VTRILAHSIPFDLGPLFSTHLNSPFAGARCQQCICPTILPNRKQLQSKGTATSTRYAQIKARKSSMLQPACVGHLPVEKIFSGHFEMGLHKNKL
jgi:hypothetical protein